MPACARTVLPVFAVPLPPQPAAVPSTWGANATGTPAMVPAATPSFPLEVREPGELAVWSVVVLTVPVPPQPAAVLLTPIGRPPWSAAIVPETTPLSPSVVTGPPTVLSWFAKPSTVALDSVPNARLLTPIGAFTGAVTTLPPAGRPSPVVVIGPPCWWTCSESLTTCKSPAAPTAQPVTCAGTERWACDVRRQETGRRSARVVEHGAHGDFGVHVEGQRRVTGGRAEVDLVDLDRHAGATVQRRRRQIGIDLFIGGGDAGTQHHQPARPTARIAARVWPKDA